MKITKEIFKESFFSIGAGLDIEPLLRFTNIIDSFIYVNLYIDLTSIEKWYDKVFSQGDFSIIDKTIIENFDEIDCFELNNNYISHLTNPDFISREDLIAYQNTFRSAMHDKQFAIIYKLHRIAVDRNITLYFFTGEGIASYVALSQNGLYAPKIFSTIETGVLEHPESIMNNFFSNPSRKLPLIWIRGFEPRYYPYKFHNNALDSLGVFNKKVLDFNSNWNCGWSYSPRQQSIKRYCKGFTSNEGFLYLKKLELKNDYINPKHSICFSKIEENSSNILSTNCIVISNKTKVDLNDFNGTILYWEDFIDVNNSFYYYHSWHKIINAKKQIEKLNKILIEKKVNFKTTIHIIPYCLEDQGKLYFESVSKINYKTITYASNWFDFIDLKK
jgi:hypothetical protein